MYVISRMMWRKALINSSTYDEMLFGFTFAFSTSVWTHGVMLFEFTFAFLRQFIHTCVYFLFIQMNSLEIPWHMELSVSESIDRLNSVAGKHHRREKHTTVRKTTSIRYLSP